MDSIFNKLLTYSYNITGSYEDARDLVQDVLEKYIGVDKSHVENEINYLIKTTINYSINFKNRNSKKVQFGIWLPEPVVTEGAETKLIREQTANYTLLFLMEKLDARERAVFILKEGFDYAHEEISELLDITVENSRQLLARAKKTLNNASFKRTRKIPETILHQYIQAMVQADVKALELLLVDEIALMADGGSRIKVVKDVEIGSMATAKLLQYVYGVFLQDKQYVFKTVNHQPAICFLKNSAVYNCQVISPSAQGKIESIYSIVDPDKLRLIVI